MTSGRKPNPDNIQRICDVLIENPQIKRGDIARLLGHRSSGRIESMLASLESSGVTLIEDDNGRISLATIGEFGHVLR